MSEKYQPINCDDYEHLELACQHHWILTLKLHNGDSLEGKASALISRKNIEYLLVDSAGQEHTLRLDHIASFSHPKIGTVVVNLS